MTTENLKISICHGEGGHSGLMIAEKRINAIKEMFNMLSLINLQHKIKLVEIEKSGVTKNVIPPECVVHINVKKKYVNAIKKMIEDEMLSIKQEFGEENKLEFSCVRSESKKHPVPHWLSKKIIQFFSIIPNGLNTLNERYHVAETSSNLGMIKEVGL
jgi:di/tripeptidase